MPKSSIAGNMKTMRILNRKQEDRILQIHKPRNQAPVRLGFLHLVAQHVTFLYMRLSIFFLLIIYHIMAAFQRRV